MIEHAPHIPVLLNEVLSTMRINENDRVLDGTFGAGGYSAALLDAGCKHLTALDRDPHVAPHVKYMNATYKDRFSFKQARFSEMQQYCTPQSMDAIVLDIGVSSMQIDEAQRGFSFSKDGALDMRMSGMGQSAADVVNTYDEKELADIIWRYGEERASRSIAQAITIARAKQSIASTLQLRDIVHQVVKVNPRKPVDPATKTFQALRIYVNQELHELEKALIASEHVLSEGGRLVVVTFHSLEDRIVKQFFAKACNPSPARSRHIPINTPQDAQAQQPTFTHLQRKAVIAGEEELMRNPRARSAKLRAAIRTGIAAREKYHA